jgi:transcriptional regulator with XRE-family HTH domain
MNKGIKKSTLNSVEPNRSEHCERLAKTLREARSQMSLTQGDFADKVGITPTLVGSFEHARSLPSFETIYLICKNLGIDANILLGVETEKGEGSDRLWERSVASHVISIMTALTEEQRQKIFAAIEAIAHNIADVENENGECE